MKIRLKLQTKFFLLLITLILILGIPLFYIVFMHIESLKQKNTIDIQQQVTQQTEKEIENFVSVHFEALNSIASLSKVPDTTKDQKESFVEYILLANNFIDLSILDTTGAEIVYKSIPISTINNLRSSVYREAFTQAQKYGYYIGPIEIKNNQPVFTISRSIIGNNGNFEGVVIGEVNAIHMQDIVKNLSRDTSGRAYIIDSKGQIIAHPDISEVLAGKNYSHIPVIRYLLYNDKDFDPSSVYKNEMGQDVFGFGLPITVSFKDSNIPSLNTNWYVITERIVFSPLSFDNEALKQILLISIVIFFASAVIVYFFVRSVVTPLQMLNYAVTQFSQGNFNYKVPLNSYDEVGDLYQNLIFFVEKVKNAFAFLRKDNQRLAIDRDILQLVFAYIPDGVILLDINKNIVFLNNAAERMIKIEKNEALRKPIDQIIKIFEKGEEITSSEYCRKIESTASSVVFDKSELKVISKNQNQIFAHLTIYKIKSEDYENLSYILILNDTSKEHEAALTKLDFVSMAAHELRTPLTSLRGFLYILLRDYRSVLNDKQISMLINSSIAAQRLSTLVENLLNVSRIEGGALKIEIEAIDWLSQVKEIVKELDDQVNLKKQQLVIQEPSEPLPLVLADKFRISEVLTNLVSNAITYTPVGGIIRIWFEKKDSYVITHVQDNGPGIPQDAIPNLFTKFFKVSGRLERGSKGTGLGLYIAKSIINLHNGKIWVTSKVGEGSTFSFSLPAKEER